MQSSADVSLQLLLLLQICLCISQTFYQSADVAARLCFTKRVKATDSLCWRFIG